MKQPMPWYQVSRNSASEYVAKAKSKKEVLQVNRFIMELKGKTFPLLQIWKQEICMDKVFFIQFHSRTTDQ